MQQFPPTPEGFKPPLQLPEWSNIEAGLKSEVKWYGPGLLYLYASPSMVTAKESAAYVAFMGLVLHHALAELSLRADILFVTHDYSSFQNATLSVEGVFIGIRMREDAAPQPLTF